MTVKQLPILVEVEMTGYIEHDSVTTQNYKVINERDRKEWLIPSGFKGESIILTETKGRKLSVEYLKEGVWE